MLKLHIFVPFHLIAIDVIIKIRLRIIIKLLFKLILFLLY